MIPDVSSAEIFQGYSVMLKKKRMGLEPKSTEKENVNVWMMIGVVGLLSLRPEEGGIGFSNLNSLWKVGPTSLTDIDFIYDLCHLLSCLLSLGVRVMPHNSNILLMAIMKRFYHECCMVHPFFDAIM